MMSTSKITTVNKSQSTNRTGELLQNVWSSNANAIDEINESIAKDEKIYLYCRSGNRSGKAQNILINMGYKDVINLGGINTAAKKLGLNIVK